MRFFAVGYTPLEAGFRKIRPSFEDVARTLGATPRRILRVIHLPLLRGSVLSAGLLVFVDVMKELPATMTVSYTHLDVYKRQMPIPTGCSSSARCNRRCEPRPAGAGRITGFPTFTRPAARCLC